MIPTVRIRRTALVLAAALLAASTLAACGDDSADGESTAAGSAGGAFPVTIEHTFGETTIEQQPERIVTLGWNAQDIVYALGKEPVGMPSDSYGVTDQNIKPWLTEYFDPEQTELLDTTDGPPMEKIASLRPDVILAPYEGFDEKTYQTLSKIAPTVAYPGKAWQTTWQKQTSMIGKALGQSADAKELIDEIGALTDKVAGEHPEFEGKTVSVLSLGAVTYVYMPADPRVQLLNELGFDNAPGVEKLAEQTGSDNFAPEVPKEEIDSYDADVVIAYADGVGANAVTEDPVYSNLDSFEQGSAYVLDDKRVIGGMSAVSVLSVPWVIDKIVPGLAEAAKAAEG